MPSAKSKGLAGAANIGKAQKADHLCRLITSKYIDGGARVNLIGGSLQ
jgi:hypothetical protein